MIGYGHAHGADLSCRNAIASSATTHTAIAQNQAQQGGPKKVKILRGCRTAFWENCKRVMFKYL